MPTSFASSIYRVENEDHWQSALTRQDVVDDFGDRLLDFWIMGRTESGLPDRRHFDAINLHPWLGYLSIYERLGAYADFRNRLEGSAVAEMTGENWHGRLASEVDSVFGSAFSRELRRAAVWGYPLRSTCRIYQRPYLVVDRILLPVTVHGSHVDQVFLALLPRDESVPAGC